MSLAFPRRTLAAALAALLPGAAAGQSGSDTPAFGVSTELVYVRFHIEKKGEYVGGVRPEQLRVLEDGRPQPIVLLETPSTRERTVPPEVTLVLDVSSSVMDARLLDETLLREAFFAGLSEHTKVGLCAFGGKLFCPTAPTRDVEALMAGFREAIGFSYESAGQGTRLYDSVADLARERPAGPPAPRALVVFSDGLDNRGGKAKDAIRAAQEADVRVYAVKLSQAFQETAPARGPGVYGGPPPRAMYDYKKWDLDWLAEETGGRAWEPGHVDRKALGAILRGVATEVTMENVLGYVPPEGSGGRKRRVKVELVDRSLGTLRGGERTLVR